MSTECYQSRFRGEPLFQFAVDAPGIPSGPYGLLEYFCTIPDCDCRHIYVHIVKQDQIEAMAVISYGWESKKFYMKWMHVDRWDDLLDELKGPALALDYSQSQHAEFFLEQFKELLEEEDLDTLFKAQYQRFKASLPKETLQIPQKLGATATSKKNQIGRNDPCTCGSGKKFKKCCG